jgi:hypothetical protein
MQFPRNKVLVVPYSFFVVFFTFIGATTSFKKLGVPALEPSFADLRMITSAASCMREDNWSITGLTCDPWGRPYNYPSLWVKLFKTLGITEGRTQLVGTVMILIFTISIVFWCVFLLKLIPDRNASWVTLAFVLLFVISPPIKLLMERGNVDMLMFAGLTFSFWLYINHKFLSAWVLTSFLGALKIYPFFALISFSKEKIRKELLVVYLGILTLALASIALEMKSIAERSTTLWNGTSYGTSIIPLGIYKLLNIDAAKSTAHITGYFGLACFSLLVYIILRKRIRSFTHALNSKSLIWKICEFFTPVFIFSYLAGTSYDYRLILLLPIGLSFIAQFGSRFSLLILIPFLTVILYGGADVLRFGTVGLAINIVADVFIMTAVIMLCLVVGQVIFQKLTRD